MIRKRFRLKLRTNNIYRDGKRVVKTCMSYSQRSIAMETVGAVADFLLAKIFSFYLPMGPFTTVFDSEVLSILMAAQH
ncbi:hypothetical protein TNCV_1149831 [Trichonephila clavipes]|nr:hypothetical protein TNCV_1149831 [Trichonephila clavipes]